MTKARIAITIPPELLAEAKRAVRAKRAASVSAYFAEAAQGKGRSDELKRLLSEMDEELGRPSAEAYAWARRALGA
jgi:antitoxin ParD1/3/4